MVDGFTDGLQSDCALFVLTALGLQLKLQPVKDIFLFNTKDSVDNWTASSDRSIGGTRVLGLSVVGDVEEDFGSDLSQMVQTDK